MTCGLVVQGIGLKEDCHNDKLNSGRLQWGGETNYFQAATVEVWAEGEECPAGQYRTDGVSASCQPCPEGTYRDSTGGVGVGSCMPCQAGFYGSSSGATAVTCSGPCTLGHYCPGGSIAGDANPCPAGTYGASEGLDDSACTGACPAGHYCPAGTVDYEPNKCVEGHWGGEGQSIATCAGKCEPGYNCPEGSGSPTAAVCGEGFYCPFSSTTPIAIPDGFYGIGGSSADTRSDVLPCERGHYCVGGERTPCPAGSYSSQLESASSDDCKPCVGGYYCPAGSTTATQRECTLSDESPAASLYCPTGTPEVMRVDVDHYTTPESAPLTQRTGQLPCSDGYRCVDGVRYKLIDWTPGSGCQGTLAVAVPMPEDATGGDTLATVTAVGDYPGAPDATYAVVSQAVAPSCDLEDPFEVGASDGVITLRSGMVLDHETCSSTTVVVEATSGNATIRCAVSAVTSDVNEAPLMATSFDRTVQEGSEPGTVLDGPIVASDPDLGQELAFEIVAGELDAAEGFFRVGSCSGTLSVAKDGLNHEVKSSYQVKVRVTDNGLNPLSTDTVVTIAVENVNEPPEFQTALSTMSILENSGHGTEVGTVVATDGDPGDTLTYSLSKNFDNAFAIDASSGTVSVLAAAGVSPLNFEVKNIYSIEVTVTDDATPPLAVSRSFEIKLADANDAPVLSDRSMTVPESALVGAIVGSPLRAFDEDVGTTISYQIVSGNVGDVFAIDATGQLTVAVAELDFETTPQYSLSIRATDDGIGGSGSGTLSAVSIASIDVINVNERPTISSATRTVSEAAAVNTLLEPAVASSDPDNANDPGFQVLTYSMTLGDTSKFAVEPLSGVVKVVGALDFESQQQWTIGVDVTDSKLGPYSALSASGTPDLAEGLYTDVAAGGTVNAHSYAPFSARLGSTLYTGQTVNVFMRSTSVTGLGVGSGGTQSLTVRNLKLVATDSAVKPESDTGLGWVTMYPLTVFDAGSYTLQFTAGIDLGDDYWAWQLVTASDGTVISSGTFASDVQVRCSSVFSLGVLDRAACSSHPCAATQCAAFLFVQNGIPTAWDFRDFEVAVGSLGANTRLMLQMRTSTADGSTVGTADGQLMYMKDVALFSSSSQSPTASTEQHGGSAWVPLTAVRAPTQGKFTASFEALITDGNDVFGWKLWRGTLVTIHVEDANEAPTVPANQVAYVNENTGVGELVGEASLVCSDPDTDDHLAGFTFAISSGATFTTPGGADLSYFEMDTAAGQLKVAGTPGVPDTYPPLDYETKPSLAVEVTCTDAGGLTSDPVVVLVSVRDLNEAPELADTTYSVVELAPAGTSLVLPLVAVDPDFNDNLLSRYRLVDGSESSGCEGMFTVATTGDITLAADAPTFGSDACTFTVEVYEERDDGVTPLSSQATITVEFTDTNNRPVMADKAATIAENAAGGDTVAVMVASDLDTSPPEGSGVTAQVLTFRVVDIRRQKAGVWVSELATGAFRVDSASGEVTLSTSLGDAPLDFESVALYRVVILVEDDGPGRLSTTATLEVTVTDVNEAPRITVSPMLVTENSGEGTEVSLVLGTDPDADDELAFSFAPNTVKHPGMAVGDLPFDLDATTGVITVAGPIDYETRSEYAGSAL